MDVWGMSEKGLEEEKQEHQASCIYKLLQIIKHTIEETSLSPLFPDIHICTV
jgi:hypothetical protein